MPEMSGMEFIKASKIISPKVPIIIISAFGDTSTQNSFLAEGAHRYVEKPFDIESMIRLIEESVHHLKPQANLKEPKCNFIGQSEPINNIFRQLDKVSKTNVTLLIEGDSGTGKDLIAQYVHEHSTNSKGPLVSINCSAIPENLIESELFGYEQGSFTGADAQKIGKFELANNGTLFLDEIGELDLNMQAKLLRVLQNKTLERVGGLKTIKTNARIIAATNKNLLELSKNNQFREDLYYRLSSFPIKIPPLKDRSSDIPLIANHLLNEYCNEFNKKQLEFTEDALHYLQTYEWPGNVREMQNIISRIVLLETTPMINETQLYEYIPKKIEHCEGSITKILENKDITSLTEQKLLQIHALEMYKSVTITKQKHPIAWALITEP